MKTMVWNGERWCEDRRSAWLRCRQWLVWVGGWEGGTGRDRPHVWRIWLREYPGKPIRMEPTPVSIFGHRITFYGWGGNIRLPRTYLAWVRARPDLEQGFRLYCSRDATPSNATHWVRGWRYSDIAEPPMFVRAEDAHA